VAPVEEEATERASESSLDTGGGERERRNREVRKKKNK
jgi:hypothetical protein